MLATLGTTTYDTTHRFVAALHSTNEHDILNSFWKYIPCCSSLETKELLHGVRSVHLVQQ